MTLPFTGTKAKIVETAVALFARHGYNAVSVRDIAKEVGIKDSSIYSHFASKNELLEAIVAHFRQEFLASIPATENLNHLFDVCSPREFFGKGFALFQKRVENPVLAQTYLVLMRERHDDNQAAAAWKSHEEHVIAYVAEALRILIARNLIAPRDPLSLAYLYEYPILHLVAEYIPKLCRGESTKDIETRVAQHQEFFLSLLEDLSHES